MKLDRGKTLGIACLVCGGLTFLILLPGAFWWVGFAFGAAAIFMGFQGLKNPSGAVQKLSLAGIVLALVFTLLYLGRALLWG